MRVLVAVGLRGGAELVERAAARLAPLSEMVLLNVVDSGPRRGLIDLQIRRGAPAVGRETSISAAEEAASQAAMDEALAAGRRLGLSVRILVERGVPEQVIVQVAQREKVDAIAIQASEGLSGRPQIGPASVGHTARFVLDHAPCDVLLLREVKGV
jgi:nucleotide-binding universal stress UspA family protein